MSCEYCIGFTALLGRPYEGDHYTHAPSIQALQASANAGCQLCALIIQQLDGKYELESILEESRTGYPTVIQLVGQTPEGLLNYQKDPYWSNLTGLDVNCGEDGRNDDWSCSLRLYAHEDNPAALSGVIAGRAVEQYSGSDKSLELIRKWVKNCCTTHLGCLPASSSSYFREEALSPFRPPSTKLPTRVIRVDGPKPRLYIAKKGEMGQYTTLSHCWGKTQPFTTKKDTLQDRIQGFNLDELPKTFRDAITITGKLEINYIWIDSLCIVQDDLQDWQTESAKMASVYRDSLLKIAATASPDGGKGCFFERPPDGSIQVNYNETKLKETDAGCSLSNQLTHLSLLARQDGFYDRSATFYACPGVTYIIDPLRKSPLNQRGWVVQERLLSRRRIHFAEDQLFWECQTQFLSEGGAYNRVMAEGVYDRLTQNLRALECYGPDPHRQHPAFIWNASVIGRWLNLVMQFSQKQLTQEMDVFPALAGIASVVQQRNGDEFLAGLWKSTLHLELLWIAFDAPHHPPAQWRAPSWSWAALNGEVEYYDYHTWKGFEPNAAITSAEAEWTGEPFSSPLRPNAKLVVVGLLERATYDPNPDFGRLQDITSYHLIPAGANPAVRYSYSWAVFDQEPPPPSQTFWCLCICIERTKEHYVLLLDQNGLQLNEYRRIGAGRLDTDPELFGSGQRVTITLV